MSRHARPVLRSAAFAGVALATGGAAVATVGVAPVGAAEPYREAVVVRPDGATVRTEAVLLANTSYVVAVEGTYRLGSRHADAECSTPVLDAPWWRGGEGFDLLLDGADVYWEPADGDALGCDSRTHRYLFTVRMPTDRPLELAIDVPAGAVGSGELTVVVDGAGPADAPDDQTAPEAPAEPADGGSGPVPERAPEDPAPASPAPPAEPDTSPPVRRQPSSVGPAPAARPPSKSDAGGGAGSEPSASPPGTSSEDPPRGHRRLSTEELLDVFAPERRMRDEGPLGQDEQAAARTIELAAEPADPAAPAERISWIVLVAALAVASAALRPGPRRDRLVRLAWAEARTVWEVLSGDQRRRALAHRGEPGRRRRRSPHRSRVAPRRQRSAPWRD